jgi:hypothetical protein
MKNTEAQRILDKRQLLRFVGHESQLVGTMEYRLIGGKADGVRALDLSNGSGLECTVLVDRGLDLTRLKFRGRNLSYLTKASIVASQYYDEPGLGFLWSFGAGLLTTCGLTNVGAPSVDQGEALGIHGRISNTPAETVTHGINWETDPPAVEACGRVREARFMGQNMVLHRRISLPLDDNRIIIHDRVENEGFESSPLMILYHITFGYPLLDEGSLLISPSTEVRARDPRYAEEVARCGVMQGPNRGFQEQFFYHEIPRDRAGKSYMGLLNPRMRIASIVHFDPKQLPCLIEWKQLGEGDYVFGIEPSNCPIEGRAKVREDGELQFIEPGEIRPFDLEIEILDDLSMVDTMGRFATLRRNE